ncbi:MAG: cystathionine beta-lyase [Pseudomonadota bacterium]
MKEPTKLVTAGRPVERPAHPVNQPVERASTILFPTYDDFLEGKKKIRYGRLGTSSHRALEEAVTALEGGVETRLAPSGMQACVAAILAFVKNGDHILMADGVYDPTRKFAEGFLKKFGVETTFFDPMLGGDIKDLMRPETTLVFAEAPSSLTFEVCDLPAIAAAAHEGGGAVVVDNTWSAGVYYKPLSLGADVSVQACTKYLCGHADSLVGSISAAHEDAARAIFQSLLRIGSNVSADDAYLTLRGMRTLTTRLERHQATGLKLAKWLGKREDVKQVLHPALKTTPGHANWKRDFTGASGLFGIVLETNDEPALRAFHDALRLFGMGFSWGGFESLCIPVDPAANRSAVPWTEDGAVLRLHAGLEDLEDLVLDLESAFAAMAIALD